MSLRMSCPGQTSNASIQAFSTYKSPPGQKAKTLFCWCFSKTSL